MQTTAVIMAAGKGTRMKSASPKVLHKAAGRTMLAQVLHQTRQADIKSCCIVVGHGAEAVQESIQAEPGLDMEISFALQEPQLGTGHCAQQAMPHLPADCQNVLILCGDTPLLRAETLLAMQQKFQAEPELSGLVLTNILETPKGYGRIIRNETGGVCGIVEEKDATPEQRLIQEINAGAYIFNCQALRQALSELKNDNAQGEYYLTDVIQLMAGKGLRLASLPAADPLETSGVNDRLQLAAAAAELYRRKAEELMLSGVTLIDPAACYIELDVEIGQDTVIFPGCQLQGRTKIGAGCTINADCLITDSLIGDSCTITKAVLNQAEVARGANIGPFAYLRPGTRLAEDVKIGDFAEVKNANIGRGSKIPHLSYIGDADVGENVNIGCGTITCNYDGVNKHRTIIGDNVFVGSNSNLVAPVTVQADAYIAAGSTITKEVAPGALAIERSQQRQLARWSYENSPKAKSQLNRKK